MTSWDKRRTFARGGHPVRVGVVGVNRTACCVSYEGERAFRTDGRKYKHPIDEAEEAERRLARFAAPAFDEFIVLRFAATNEPPFDFRWGHENETRLDYGAILARIGADYDGRS